MIIKPAAPKMAAGLFNNIHYELRDNTDMNLHHLISEITLTLKIIIKATMVNAMLIITIIIF